MASSDFLKLTAFFIFQFWLMIVNHYSLRGSLLGLPATAIVGSSAIVLLAFLIVKVRQPIPRLPVESPSPWNTRLELVFSIMGFLLAGLLLPVNEEALLVLLLLAVLAICLWIYIGLISLVSSVLLNIRLLELLGKKTGFGTGFPDSPPTHAAST